MIWGIAANFHFDPERIWGMDLNELWFWYEGVERITESME